MLQALFYLDYVIKFLFITSKSAALEKSLKLFNQSRFAYEQRYYCPVDIESPRYMYETRIRSYLGLGFLFSFIPGTEAFTARTEYLTSW